MILIPCGDIAEKIIAEVKTEIEKRNLNLTMAVILASADQSSITYIKHKTKKAKEVGIESKVVEIAEHLDYREIIEQIEDLNNDSRISGILLQLPLYPTLLEHKHKIINAISPKKDIDCLTSTSLGNIIHNPGLYPATVSAILECLEFCFNEKIEELAGKNILVINNSNLIGKPLSLALENYNATVTVANKFSQNLKDLSLTSDVVVTATGQTQIFDESYFKKDAIVLDVTSVKKDGKVLGDVIFSEKLEKKLSYLSPVPGGIGPLTIACLLKNLVKLN